VSIEFPASSQRDVETVAGAVEAEIPVKFSFVGLKKSQGVGGVLVTLKSASCGCSLLESSAMPHDDTWSFRPEAAGALAGAVEKVAMRKSGELAFQAIWLGPDRDELKTIRLRLSDLVKLIRSSEISQTVRYLASSRAA
jgi:hypothetical protein